MSINELKIKLLKEIKNNVKLVGDDKVFTELYNSIIKDNLESDIRNNKFSKQTQNYIIWIMLDF